MYIMSDIAHMLKVQQESLDTLAQVEIEEFLPSIKMTSAHPHKDREKKDIIWNIGTASDPKKGYSYAVIKYEKENPDWTGKPLILAANKSNISIFLGTMILENANIVTSIPCRHKHSPSFYHSFGMTRDYIVFVEQPLYVDEMDKMGMGAHPTETKNGQLAGTGVHNNLRWKKTEMVNTIEVKPG